MTALDQYSRLEAPGLWRAAPDAQRREVVVSLGAATLVITDLSDRALAHWSLAAVSRANPGDTPALFHPDGDPDEVLEIGPDGSEMVAAIEKLRAAIRRRRPRKGRVRMASGIATAVAVAALGVFWVPEALVDHALSVVPPAQRATIGEALVLRMQRLTGSPCAETTGVPALARLADRLPGPQGRAPRLIVLAEGLGGVRLLPGRIIVVDRRLIEEEESPDVLAGHILSVAVPPAPDPLEPLLRAAGTLGTLRLLTTGALPDPVLARQAERLLTEAPPLPDAAGLIAAFTRAEVRATPYARAVSNQTPTDRDPSDLAATDAARTALTDALLQQEPWPDLAPRPVLSDADWVRLQGICGG